MQTLFSITQRVEDAIVYRLSDTSTGLVPVLTQMAKEQDIPLPDLDLTEDGNQLFRAQITIDDYLDIENNSFPAILVYTVLAEDQHRLRGVDFSGDVTAGIEIFLTDQENEMPVDLQRLTNLFSDSLFHVFGIANCFHLNDAGISLNGGLRVSRTRPKRNEAAGWFQAVGCVLPLFIT